MTKKHFNALARYIKDWNADENNIGRGFSLEQISYLASFCSDFNPLFDTERFIQAALKDR